MKQPFSVQNPKLRGFLLDFSVLLNHAERYNWNPFADERYERLMVDMLEKRKDSLFQRLFKEEQKRMKPSLDDMVVQLTKAKADANVTQDLMNRRSDEENGDLMGKIRYSSFEKTPLSFVEYRIKSERSFWRKFVRTLRDEKSHESRRNDFQGIRLVWESQDARDYLKDAGWEKFDKSTIGYIATITSGFIEKWLENNKELQLTGKRFKESYKEISKGFRPLRNGKDTPGKCEKLCRLISSFQVSLRSEPGYSDLIRELDLARNYANLTEAAKKYYKKIFRDANHSLIHENVSDIVENHQWTTLPYGPIVMQLEIPRRQSLEKEVTVQSQVVMSRTREASIVSYDVDYLLFNTAFGADEFISRLDIPFEKEDLNLGTVLYGTRLHSIDKEKNFAMFRQANMVVYVSFDGSLEQFRDFMDEKPDNGESLKDIIARKFSLARPLMEELDKATAHEVVSTKKSAGPRESIYETRGWHEKIYNKQKKVFESIIMRNNELDPRFSVFLDTFRADITSKFPRLSPVKNVFKNMAAFVQDYITKPKDNDYEGIQFRICYDLGPERTENKELGYEIQNQSPDGAYNADRGKAAHYDYKEKEWKKIDPAISLLGELMFGDNDRLFSKYYSRFHYARINNNLDNAVNEFINGNEDTCRAYLDKMLESYQFLKDAEKSGKTGDVSGNTNTIRGILRNYFSRDRIYAYADLISGSDISGIRSLQKIVREELNLLSEHTREELHFTDIDRLLMDKDSLYSDFCDAVVETAGNIADFITRETGIKSEYGVKVVACSLLEDYQHAVPHFDEESAENREKYEESIQKIKDIQARVSEYVEADWEQASHKSINSCITRIPGQIKPYKLKSSMTPENIQKFLGRVDSSAARLCIEYLEHALS